MTQERVNEFADVTDDHNPIHVDPAFSARTSFGRTVAHGMLLYARVWALMTAARPGARALSQSLMFPAPAYADEELEIAIEATEGSEAYVIKVTRVHDGAEVLAGECTTTECR